MQTVHLALEHSNGTLCRVHDLRPVARVLAFDDIDWMIAHTNPAIRAQYAVDRDAWCAPCLAHAFDMIPALLVQCDDPACNVADGLCTRCNNLMLTAQGASY